MGRAYGGLRASRGTAAPSHMAALAPRSGLRRKRGPDAARITLQISELFFRRRVCNCRARRCCADTAVYWPPPVDNFEHKRVTASSGTAADG